MRHDDDIPAQSTFLPLALSVLVHGAILGVLWLYNPTPKPAMPTGIEAGFVSASDIAQVEGAIRENARQAELQAAAMASQNTGPSSSSATEYNDALAKKEAAFQAQIAKFAAEQDAAIQAQMDDFEAHLQDEYAQDQAELQEARQAYAQRDQITAQNKKALDAANEQNKKNQNNNQSSSQSASQGNGRDTPSAATGNQSSSEPSGTNSPTTRSTQSGKGKDSIQQAVTRHIKAHWNPIGAEGTRLNTSIRVDADGNVLSVRVTGGTEAQRKSLEDAIYASSPITPIVGTEYRAFSPYFTVQ